METTSLSFPRPLAPRIGASTQTISLTGIQAGQPWLAEAFRVVIGRFANQAAFAMAVEDGERNGTFVADLRDSPTFAALKERAEQVDPGLVSCQCGFRDGVKGEARYPLELRLSRAGGTLAYDPGFLSMDLAERMAAHFQALVPRIRAEARIAAVDSAGAEEREVLASFNRTRTSFPTRSISALFSALPSDQVALLTSEGPLTCGQLAELRDRYIVAIDSVHPGERVGLRLRRSKELLGAMLACVEKKAVFVPMDPAYPAERTKFMIEDSQPRFVFEHAGKEVVVSERPTNRPPCPPEALYVLYTSGSTGRPKGVIGTHVGTLNRLEWAWREFPYVDGDVACAKTSPNFVDSIAEFFGPLLQGCPLAVLDDAIARDPMALAGAIEKHRVTRLIVVPSLLRVLLEYRSQLASLRHLVSSGETLLPDLVATTLVSLPAVRLYNYYGSSEVAGDATFEPVLHPVEGGVPIGRPIANTSIHLLDPMGGDAPLGAKGEIAVGGANLAMGYLHRPELDGEKFLDHPVHGRLYRTGDLGQWLPDGTLLYHGREDNMVKVRGHRIELYEVETTLKSIPGIDECAVVPSTHESAIYAYFAPAIVTKKTAREFLEAKLPGYMVPARFVPLERLPKLPNGKIDRQALPPPPEDESADPPIGDLEERIHRIFCEILGVQSIGRETNFFEHGGDSLRAASAASRLARELQIEITTTTIFESPSIAELGTFCSVILDIFEGQMDPSEGLDVQSAIAAEYAMTHGAQSIPIRADRTRARLSLQQQRLWLLEEIKPAGYLYNIATMFRIEGVLDSARLRQALNALVQRHESLRTAIRLENGTPLQIILPHEPIELPEHATPTAAEFDRLADEMAMVNLRLEEGRLFRAALAQIDREHHVLFFTTHHIVSDGWSISLMARELTELYADPERLLAPIPVQYGDYAEWQHDWISSAALRHQFLFWFRTLEGPLPLLDLPTDYPRPALQSHEGATRRIAIPMAHIAAIQQGCEGVTPFMVLLTLFQALLWRLTDQTDILVGTPYAGRTRAEIEGIAGFFVNTLVLRSRLDPGMSLRALLRQVRETTLRAFEHPDVPFESLVEELKPERNLAYSPIFQAFFVLNTPEMQSSGHGLKLAIEERHNGGAKFDLTLELAHGPEEFVGHLEYPVALFSDTAVQAFADQLTSAAQRAATTPDVCLWDLFAGDNVAGHPTVSVKRGSLIDSAPHALSPDAPALIAGDFKWSYGELNERVESLAGALRDAGVEPGNVVGIRIGRSPEAVIALLATLRTGGVYLPLDPKYPKDRTDYMLADASPALMIEEGLRIIRRSEGKSLPPEQDPAYILYTSGSTGRPKGVIGTHHATLNRLAWMDRCHPISRDEVAIQKTSLNFVDSVAEIFAPLRAGIPLVFPEDSMPEAVARCIAQHGVTRLIAVPSLLRALMDLEADLQSLRLIVSSGEVLPRDLAQNLLAQVPGLKLLNLYGSSEVAGDVTCHEVTPESLRRASIPIGTPIDSAEVLIADARLRRAPDGFPGQIVVRGPVMAAGYLSGPQDRFAQGLFLTGDLGRRLPGSGDIEYMGRKDRQMKVAGIRIEPEEIEAVLRTHPRVRDAAVFLYQDSLAVVVAADCSSEEVHGFQRTKLPAPMIAHQIAMVEALPLLPNGKVDRAELPNLLRTQPENAFVPLTPRAATIAPVWQTILHLDGVPGGDAHFFRLGGNSLSAARLRTMLIQRLGMEVPTGLIFEHPTLNAYAEAIGSEHPDDLPTRMESDSALADALRFSRAAAGAPRHVFMTGATGFLGSRLAKALVDAGIEVTALVRRADVALPPGVHTVIGDLEQPGFGLSPDVYAGLGDRVDAVVHAGAKVKFLEPYSTCRSANVLGTLEVLRFCATRSPKVLTYFSTLAVYEALGSTDTPVIYEDTPLELSRGNAIGYTQTKWVAERLVQSAMRAGLSARILRPGPTSGDSQTGELNPDDFQGRFIAGCIAAGCYPAITTRIDFTPVDYVTAAALELAIDPATVGRAFHLNTPYPLSIDEAFALIGIPAVPWSEWWQCVQAQTDSPIADTLPIWDATIRAGFSPDDVLQIGRSFDTTNTRNAVRAPCPVPDRQLVATLVAPLTPAPAEFAQRLMTTGV